MSGKRRAVQRTRHATDILIMQHASLRANALRLKPLAFRSRPDETIASPSRDQLQMIG